MAKPSSPASKTPDPYKILELSHSATPMEIKKSYRELARQCHPDRLMTASPEEQDRATKHFSEISAAYALLMDPQRKAQYDHIYKYGGFDDEEEDPAANPAASAAQPGSRKRKTVGVGYTCTDPVAFLWNSGDVISTKKVAGLQIPSRFQMGHPGAGFQVTLSTGEFRYDGSTRQYITRTTQFSQGKKFTKTETTTIHKDGRKDVLIQGDNFVERRTTNVQSMASHEEHPLPWYVNAWHVVKTKLSSCYTPCTFQ